ncbi:hypothetical protein D3C71_2066110 [compost metagenome]
MLAIIENNQCPLRRKHFQKLGKQLRACGAVPHRQGERLHDPLGVIHRVLIHSAQIHEEDRITKHIKGMGD